MNAEGHFFRWASRILAVVCLLLLVLNLLRRSNEEPSPSISEPSVADPAPPVAALSERRVVSDFAPRSERAEARVRRTGSFLPAVSHAKPMQVSRRRDTPLPAVIDRRYSKSANLGDQSSPPPEPVVTTLKPIGYVERADGTVEAVVADGPYVAVLREGELFRDEYRVAKVTPTLVEIQRQPVSTAPELAELAEPPAPKREVAAGQAAASAPVSPVPIQPVSRPEPQAQPSSSGSEEIPTSNLNENREVRPPEQESPQALAESRGDSRGPGPAKPAGSTPAPAQVPARPTRTFKPLGYVEWAGGRHQAVVEDEGEIYLVSEGEVFGDRYRALRVTPSSVEFVEGLSPPARASPIEWAAFGAGQQSATRPLIEVAHSPPKWAENVGRASRKRIDSARAGSDPGRVVPVSPRTETLPAQGYVERQDGQLQAILADGDDVSIVGPGDVVGGKYLALSVSRSSVEVGAVADGRQILSAGTEAEDRGATASEGLAAASGAALGYVKMADGRVQTIVADGDGVDLVHDGFESAQDRQPARQPLVAASHSPPGDGLGAASPQEVGHEASESGPGLAYLVTHVHSPRFDFDLHVRLPDNRSD